MSINLNKILEEMKILPELKYGKICLQSVEGNNDPFLGIGSWFNDIISEQVLC